MARLKKVASTAKKVSRILNSAKARHIPKDTLTQIEKYLNNSIEVITPVLPPSPAEKREAREHPLSSEIVNFATQDSDHKRVFNLDYFKTRFKSLPEDRKIIAPNMPRTMAALRNAIILYYYRKGKDDNYYGLKGLKEEMVNHYQSHPEIQKKERARDFFEKLMRCDDKKIVARKLATSYPELPELKDFSRLIGIKIPTQKKGKNALKKTAWERLAEAIHSAGAVSRSKLE